MLCIIPLKLVSGCISLHIVTHYSVWWFLFLSAAQKCKTNFHTYENIVDSLKFCVNFKKIHFTEPVPLPKATDGSE